MDQNSAVEAPSGGEQIRAVARILAAGVLRLRARAALTGDASPKNPENSASAGLEVRAETRLSVQRG
jgi:hypothetical protein